MLVFTVDIDYYTICEVCHTPCGVFDSEEKVMQFIKTDPEHLKYLEKNPEFIMNIFYIVNVWELNKYRESPLRTYEIYRKDL